MMKTDPKEPFPVANLLIADDMPDSLLVLSQTLKRLGYCVRAVMDGESALSAAQTSIPDLVMLDVDMPGINGYETCRRLKADPRTADIPVIFISAMGDVGDKINAFHMGGVDYVTKPFQVEEVQARIEIHLALRRLQTQLEATNRLLELRLVELDQVRESERQQRLFAETLRDTIAALNSTLDYAEVLNLILDNLEKVVPHYAASLALIDENSMVRVERSRGHTAEEVRLLYDSFHISDQSHYIWRRVLETGLPVLIPDTSLDAEWMAQPHLPWVRSFACAPTTVRGQVIGFLHLESPQPGFFTSEHIWRLQTFADQAAVAIEKARLFDEAQRLATTDGLTGINNRRQLSQLCDREYDRAQRFHHPLAVLMADIDHFKRVNDTYGHPVGDIVLKTVANVFQKNLRTVDVLGRYGGEEFLVLLPDTSYEQALVVAERLRLQLECAFPDEILPVPVTISLGMAASQTLNGLTLAALINMADDALYAAKAAGRNRVCGVQYASG